MQALHWSIDIAGATSITISDNVIDFLLEKVRDVDDDLREFMKTCALFGNKFSGKPLANFLKKSNLEIMELIKNAQYEELILQVFEDGSKEGLTYYQFAHDRIQQVFYDLFDENEKPKSHYALGRSLIQSLTQNEIEENCVKIVDHLNFGLEFPLSERRKTLLST